MTHRAEVLHLYSDELNPELGEFGSATEARAACTRHEDGVLSWTQLWEVQGKKRQYRVISRR